MSPAPAQDQESGDDEDPDGERANTLVGDVQGSLPQTKSELQKLRQTFGNTMRLCAHLYADRALQEDLRMVSAACGLVNHEYHAILLQQKSQDSVSYPDTV